jgi:aspartate/methionine/tyrosine aminotransferase
MQIAPFKLEQYFAKHEFTAKYMLSSSDCDGFPMEYVLKQASPQEMELWNTLTLGYTEGLGSMFLREAICKFYKKAKPENVMVASPGELSFILMNVLMHREANGNGQPTLSEAASSGAASRPHAVVISPAYQSLYQVLESLDCEVSYWRPKQAASAAGWYYDVENLRKLVRKDTRLIIINFPHNPTGAYITPAQQAQIVEIARSCGAYIYSDEMYRELVVKEGVETLPSVSDIYEKGVSLWGTAKSFGLAGLRTGWFVSQDRELLSKIHAFKDYLSICSSAPSEVLTAIALNHREKFITPNIEKIKENVAFFKQAVEAGRLPFVKKFVEPVAGSIAFVEIEPSKAEYLLGWQPQTALEFSDAIVEKYGIMTVPAPMFDYPGNYLRIGFGRENFQQVLRLLMHSSC